MLEGTFDVVVFAVFNEVGAGLFEPGGYLFFFAYAAEFHLLVEVAGADFIAGFATCYYLFYPLAYVVGSKIDALQQWFANDDFEYITPNVPLVSLTNVPDISLLNVPLFTGCN